jgi:hypothetical protein
VHAEIREDDVDNDGEWDPGERIYIVNYPYPANEEDAGGWLGDYPSEYVYRIEFGEGSVYSPGDVFRVVSNKPLTDADRFEFMVAAPSFSEEQLAEDLETITVVPNPFVVSSEFERGRFGVQRMLQFHQLPEQATIRIYTSAGELLQKLNHDGGSIEGWNLQSYNGQEVGFGVYLYIVQTPDGLEKTGKFAVIK